VSLTFTVFWFSAFAMTHTRLGMLQPKENDDVISVDRVGGL